MDQSGSRLQVKRGTRAKVDAAAVRGELLQGEPLLITDEGRLAVATSTSSYEPVAKQSEVTSSFKNKIINGGFDIWQRGTSFTTSSTYTADRFSTIGTIGVGITSITKQDFLMGENEGGARSYLRLIANGTSAAGISQRIEDVRTFAGKTVTLSFKAKANSNVTIDTIRLRQNFGSGGSTEIINIGLTSANLTTSWQTFSYTIDVPSVAGKTLGADSYLMVEIRKDITAYTLDITEIQLEEGSVFTSFEQRPIGLELLLCQRYYFRTSGNGVRLGAGYNSTSTTAQHVIVFPVEMRVAPSVFEQSGTPSDYRIYQQNTTTLLSAVPVIGTSSKIMGVIASTVASGLNAGGGSVLSIVGSSGYIGFSAEL